MWNWIFHKQNISIIYFNNLFQLVHILKDEGLSKQEVVAELPEDQPEVIPEASIGNKPFKLIIYKNIE